MMVVNINITQSVLLFEWFANPFRNEILRNNLFQKEKKLSETVFDGNINLKSLWRTGTTKVARFFKAFFREFFLKIFKISQSFFSRFLRAFPSFL